MNYRTDLVAELTLDKSLPKGTRMENHTVYGVPYTVFFVDDEAGSKSAGKPVGRYITFDIGDTSHSSKDEFETNCRVVASQLKKMLPEKYEKILIACLGNREITADAVGPMTAKYIVVTGHIKRTDETLFSSLGLKECYCICPDVLGNTGMEAVDIVKGAVTESLCDAVIAVDALASRKLSRLAKTLQIADTGISPGSGIHNTRKEFSKRTLGVPVIAVGVPTVVDASTLARDILCSACEKAGIDEQTVQPFEQILYSEHGDFFVTPKEADSIIKAVSKLIGFSINLALNPDMTFDEMDELTK